MPFTRAKTRDSFQTPIRCLSQLCGIFHLLPTKLISAIAVLYTVTACNADSVKYNDPLFVASSLHVRRSRPVELSVQESGEPAGILFGDSTWQTSDRYLWHTQTYDTDLLGRIADRFSSDTSLTIAVPFVDYSRSLDFAVNQRLIGNEFQIDVFAVFPTWRLANFIFPQDESKEYLQLVDPLPSGHYSVAARYFQVANLGRRDADIDFARFMQDPIGYQLPLSTSLTVIVQRASFQVLPEPSTLPLFGLLTVAWIAVCRQPKRSRMELRQSIKTASATVSKSAGMVVSGDQH